VTPGRARWAILVAFALILLAAIEVARQPPLWQRPSLLVSWLVVAGLAWGAALGLARRELVSFKLVVLGALVLRIVALSSFPDLSDDIYRYAWEGARVLEGTSPYAAAPAAPELAAARALAPDLYAKVNHPEISAAYPPLTQFALAAVVGLARSLELDAIMLLRAFFACVDLCVLWPLALLLRQRRLPLGLALGWGWCPLVTLEFAGSGHFDSLGILCLMAALALFAPAAGSWRAGLATLFLAGAVVVKFLPLCALPFVARGRLRRVPLVLGLCALSFVPFLLMGGGGFFSGLGEYGLRWESGSLVQRHLEPVVELLFERDGSWLDSRLVTRGLLGCAWLVAGAWAWRRGFDSVRATGFLLGAFLILSPTLHPWYVTWIVPFIALCPRLSWVWLVCAMPTAYLSLAAWKTAGVWQVSPLSAALIGLPFAALLCFERVRARTHPRAS
jgi:hypothetical protein